MLAKLKSNIFKKWFSTFYAYGNFEKHCPVQPNYYYMKDFKIHEFEIPSFLFPGIYRLTFNMIQGQGKNKSMEFVIGCIVEIEVK
ncbi:uncharacterized protein Dvir_GJ11645 [Drosophila virilis]|uniref:MD-2-related lipid-recognition domain-containing protein n=1 Tax=Drosophila virilis TaxID=7244 RepID=B4LF90_DROVI|nr:uncharacterized protein Dvir_GJ11645 [Drosophila virilis]